MSKSGRSSDTRLIRKAVSALCTILGFGTLLAWHSQQFHWVRWTFSSPPLHYNSALVFLLFGFLFSEGATRYRRLAEGIAYFVILVSIATLFEHFFGLDLGLDELFLSDPLTLERFAPGRTSPNSCVCGILIAASVLVRLRMPESHFRSIVLQALGSGVFALGVTAILGYIGGISAAYTWGNLTRMPLQSAIGFAILGKATTIEAWLSDPKFKGFGRFSLGTPIAFSVVAFAVALSQALVSESATSTGRAIDVLANQLGETLHQIAKQSVTRVEDIAVEGLLSSQGGRLEHVLQSQIPSVTAVVSFDRQGKAHWLYRRNAQSTEAYMRSSEALLQSVLTTFPNLKNSATESSRPFQDSKGNWSLMVLFPAVETATFPHIALQLDLEKIVTQAVSQTLPIGFYSRVTLDGEEIFEGSSSLSESDVWLGGGKKIDWAMQQEIPFSFLTVKGMVAIAPNRSWSALNQKSYLPLVTLFSGVLFALLIASLGHLAIAARAQQQEAERANQKLKDEISRRQEMEQELRKAKEIADRANQSKSFFLANISHELRTPLGVVIGFSNLLKSKQWSREEAEHFLDRILNNSTELTRIIDDLLDLTKAETGHLLIEETEFSLKEFFEDLESSLKLRATGKGVTLHFIQETPLPNWIITDRTRLRQILVNIIGNGIKFTDVGAVTVRLSRARSTAMNRETLRIAVQDSGVGLGEEQRNLIFRAFGQADRILSSRVGGTGLGLLLSRQLARLLQGDVVLAQSAPGVGSLFQISIEYEISERALSTDNLFSARETGVVPGHTVRTRELVGVHVLVAEDAADNQFLLQNILQGAGALVTITEDGQKALQKLSQSAFDVVLMDLQMPVMDGYQAVRGLRAQGLAVPVIALTAHAMREEKERCLKAGFDAYLTKPIQLEQLLQTIKRFASANTSPAHLNVAASDLWADI
jgi:signal transduction histidine kinase/ActR/RegA family two-component response regulator